MGNIKISRLLVLVAALTLVEILADLLVARGRFELPSGAPEAPMLDRYTTGLQFILDAKD